jgi:hypothetical protein
VYMSPLEQFDRELEKIIRELTLRIVAPQFERLRPRVGSCERNL